MTLFLFACASAFSQVASELLTCLSEPQRQTRQTQTDKTAPPRDTEKTVKSDATETKDTKLLHAKFLTRKFQCNEVSLMLSGFSSEQAPDILNQHSKHILIRLQILNVCMNSLDFFRTSSVLTQNLRCKVLFCSFGPFLHEKKVPIFEQLGFFHEIHEDNIRKST